MRRPADPPGRPAARGRAPGGAAVAPLAAAVLVLLLGGCGAKALVPGTAPFPAGKPVFVDGEGRPRRELPPGAEPLTLLFLDFPWCPPCADNWEAVARASGQVPPGSARVVRVLFDREISLSRGKSREVPPLRDPPPPPAALRFPVTTLLALPGPFREEYRVEQAPLLLLLDRDGTLLARWTGDYPALADAIASAITLRSSAPPLPER